MLMVYHSAKDGFLIQVIKQILPPSSSLEHEIKPQMDLDFKQSRFSF